MIYQYTLYPLEFILETLLVILIGISSSYFWSIVILAVLVRLAIKPLENYANRMADSETEIQSILRDQIDDIKRKFSAGQRHAAIKRLYKRYSYHPLFAIRALSGLLIQLPFFIAAYYMLTGFSKLDGVIVPILGDLGKPDMLLFGNFHLMPFVMTVVNVLALITTPGFGRKNLVQGLFVSIVFLVILYAAPLSLLIYWTSSNLFSLISNFTPAPGPGLSKRFKNSQPGRLFEEYAYLLLVTSLAFLLPLLGVLGDQFNFFTAHSLTGQSILLLLLSIILIPTFFLFILRWIAKHTAYVNIYDGIVLFTFIVLFLTYIFNKIGYGRFPASYEPLILFCLAILTTIACVAFIFKKHLLRNLSYLSLIVPLIFLHFIFVSPASTLFERAVNKSPSSIITMNNTPVFLLVFDEFSGLTIQNPKGELDVGRYPGFAKLAAQADYFPNALTADYHTKISVPSIVSGNFRRSLPPEDNLIEMFRSLGSVHAYSSVLPAELMYTQDVDGQLLSSDLLTLYIHIVSHKDWIEEKIGPIPETWKGFGIFFKKDEGTIIGHNINPEIDRFYDWLATIEESGANNQFNFLHIEFPHVPYDTTSLGRNHYNGIPRELWGKKPGLPGGSIFYAEQTLLNSVYHLYMHQSFYVDKLLEDFVKTLKQHKLFEKSLIIVTADHGVSYNRRGISRREPVNAYAWKNIISVPLFVKYPKQDQPQTITSFVTTLDISATIMGALEIDSPWESVGRDLGLSDGQSPTPSVNDVFGYKEHFQEIDALFQESRDRKNALFSEGTPISTVAVNYTENSLYSDLLYTQLSQTTVGNSSSLAAVWYNSLKPSEIFYFGQIFLGSEPVNDKVIAAAVDGTIVAIFTSGQSRTKNGFFTFAIPESEGTPTPFDLTLYEIEGKEEFILRQIAKTDKMLLSKNAFDKSQLLDYDWKNSIQRTNGLDSLTLEDEGIRIVSSTSKDPFIVFRPVLNSTISEPVFRITFESNRDFNLNLYYQTAEIPRFDASQRLDYRANKGMNTLYIEIPRNDFLGKFRVDVGTGGKTNILFQAIEIRRKGEFILRRIATADKILLSKNAFDKSQLLDYDWKSSIQRTNGLDSIAHEGEGIRIVSSTSKDPFIVFRPVLNSTISEPVFRITFESNRDFNFALYYQTAEIPRFGASQRLDYRAKKGMNTVYIEIPRNDFLGAFRVDVGSGGKTNILFQAIEIRRKGEN